MRALTMLLAVVLFGCLAGCTATLKMGETSLQLEIEEYAQKPLIDYIVKLTDDKLNEQSVEVEEDDAGE